MPGDNFKAVLLEMYKKKQGFDFKVHIDNSSEVFEAHKLVLALASETFYKSFFETTKSKLSNALLLKGINAETFEQILGFIYGKEVEFQSLKDAGEFYKGSYTLKCKDALSYVTEYMIKEVKAETAIYIYELASMNANQKIVDMCLKVFSENTNDLIRSTEFLSAHPKTIETIYNLDKLNIDSEAELVRALELYIKTNQEQKPNIAKKVRGALNNIRWLTLAAKDIAQTTLLANHEIVNVIGCLDSEDKSKMPPALSQNTNKRSLTTHKRRMARLMHDKFTTNCFKCSTFNHPIWGCKKAFSPTRKNQLKKIYEKYGHTFLMEYDDSDLQIIYDLFVEFGILE